MAVGLAVIADDQIILCSDQPANSDRKDADETVEDSGLSHNWRALITGESPVVGALYVSLYESFEWLNEGNEADVLRAINLGLQSFKRYLFKEPRPPQLIIAGFLNAYDGIRRPVLFSSNSDWSFKQDSNFSTVGEGSLAARISLLSRGTQNAKFKIDDAAYLVFEAKRLAERAAGVSERSSLTIYASDGSERSYDTEGYLSELYAKFGPRPFTGIEVAPNLFPGL